MVSSPSHPVPSPLPLIVIIPAMAMGSGLTAAVLQSMMAPGKHNAHQRGYHLEVEIGARRAAAAVCFQMELSRGLGNEFLGLWISGKEV